MKQVSLNNQKHFADATANRANNLFRRHLQHYLDYYSFWTFQIGNGIKVEESGFLKNAGVPDQEIQVIANQIHPKEKPNCALNKRNRIEIDILRLWSWFEEECLKMMIRRNGKDTKHCSCLVKATRIVENLLQAFPNELYQNYFLLLD